MRTRDAQASRSESGGKTAKLTVVASPPNSGVRTSAAAFLNRQHAPANRGTLLKEFFFRLRHCLLFLVRPVNHKTLNKFWTRHIMIPKVEKVLPTNTDDEN